MEEDEVEWIIWRYVARAAATGIGGSGRTWRVREADRAGKHAAEDRASQENGSSP
jgi:alkylhydroperoxidase family enzyme